MADLQSLASGELTMKLLGSPMMPLTLLSLSEQVGSGDAHVYW